MVEYWGLHLVVQLLGLVDPGVHDHVEENRQGENHDEGECKVRIQETDGDDLEWSRQKWNYFSKKVGTTCTKISIEY